LGTAVKDLHYGSKIWQAPLYGSFVNLAFKKWITVKRGGFAHGGVKLHRA
jgi:hypothetical protein